MIPSYRLLPRAYRAAQINSLGGGHCLLIVYLRLVTQAHLLDILIKPVL